MGVVEAARPVGLLVGGAAMKERTLRCIGGEADGMWVECCARTGDTWRVAVAPPISIRPTADLSPCVTITYAEYRVHAVHDRNGPIIEWLAPSDLSSAQALRALVNR